MAHLPQNCKDKAVLVELLVATGQYKRESLRSVSSFDLLHKLIDAAEATEFDQIILSDLHHLIANKRPATLRTISERIIDV